MREGEPRRDVDAREELAVVLPQLRGVSIAAARMSVKVTKNSWLHTSRNFLHERAVQFVKGIAITNATSSSVPDRSVQAMARRL